jgi:hypothetical protein
MRAAGVWCEDIARFAVWSALGLASSQPRMSAAALAKIFLLGKRMPTSRSWAADLRLNIESTVNQFVEKLVSRHRSIDTAREFGALVFVELLRAGYSSEFFDSEVRVLSIKAALIVRGSLLAS